MPCGYEKTPPANITASSKDKCPWREQDHSLPQQHHTHIAHLQALQASSHSQFLLRWTVLSRRATGLPS